MIFFSNNGVVCQGGATSNPLWNGLLAYYTADNTPNDALGTYNGTLVNGATYGTGIINQGFSLDGVNDYVNFGNNFNNDGSTPFSFSLWLKANDIVNLTYRPLLGKAFISGVTDTGWYVFTYGSRLWFHIGNSESNRLSIFIDSAIDTNWNHIAIVYDGSKVASNQKIYINGVDTSYTVWRDTFTLSSSTTQTARIGNVQGRPYFNGIIDEVAIFNKELLASEVTELYNAGAGKQYPN